MPFALHYGGDVYREADITVAQAEHIEDLIGVGWTRLNVLHHAKHARATLAVMVADRTGRSFDEVSKEIGAMTANDYATNVFRVEADDMPTEFVDGNPPKADAP